LVKVPTLAESKEINMNMTGLVRVTIAAPQRSTETIREAYRRIIDSDAFRASCGRIAASYAW